MSPTLRRILLVEDDADIRAIVTLALTAFGSFAVESVEDGNAALAVIDEVAPDLVILDYMMPGMNGLDVLAALRSSDPSRGSLPAIFLTAALASHAQQSLAAAGALGVIAKPFDAVGLAAEVQRLWDGRP